MDETTRGASQCQERNAYLPNSLGARSRAQVEVEWRVEVEYKVEVEEKVLGGVES